MTTKVTEIMLNDDARTHKFSLRIKLPSGTAVHTWPIDMVPLDAYDITQIVAQTDVATSTVDFAIEINSTEVQWTTAAGADITATAAGVTDTPSSAFSVDSGTNKPVDILVDMNTATNSPVWLFVEVFYKVTS